MSISDTHENQVLNKTFRGTDYTFSTWFVSLHTSNPGEAGTAGEVGTRMTATFDAASAGTTKNSAAVTFTGLASGTITHVAIWNTATASGAGTLIWYGTATTSVAIGSGGTVQIAAGSLIISLD